MSRHPAQAERSLAPVRIRSALRLLLRRRFASESRRRWPRCGTSPPACARSLSGRRSARPSSARHWRPDAPRSSRRCPYRNELERRLAEFADSDIPDHVWEERGLASTDTWNLPKTREALAVVAARNIIEWTYRPFDRRWVAFDERLVDRTRTNVSPHLVDGEDGNLAIAFAYGSLTDGPYVTVARSPVPAGYCPGARSARPTLPHFG